MQESVRLICSEAPLVDLLADLSVHKLDVVLADSPINPTLNIRAYNHLLGESGVTFFSTPDKAAELEEDFPRSLEGQTMLMPSSGSSLRRDLDLWLERNNINPLIIAEFDDRALMKAFGERGAGIFTSPTAVEKDVLEKYGVRVIGRTDELTERYYLISAERKIKNPAVSAITQVARDTLFQQG
jgi:LysR family transcriptional activator of nhaA